MNTPTAAHEPHWVRWHRRYDVEGSSLCRRLAVVQRYLRGALDAAASGPIQVLSLCAGRGHDVIDVVADHPRRSDVTARLVELEPALCDHARAAARAAGLEQITVVHGDASTTDAAVGAVPAHVLLLCGIFGNVSDADVRRTIELTPTLCAPGATVIWTRHRREPDLTPAVRRWFGDTGFDELAFAGPTELVGVGAHRLAVTPTRFTPGVRLFTFSGDGDP